LEGPKKHVGIEKVDVLGTVPLKGEFASPDGMMLRAREVLIAPDGLVAVHQHNGRPGVAYIINGEMTEHRAGAGGPVVKKAGDTAFEKTGVAHWWKNTGKTIAKLIVVDLVPVKN
jgi:quercetin dioxygenase-like cupin family protein